VVIFLTCSRYKQKQISNKLFTFAQCGRTRAKGAVAEWAEASAQDLSLVMEWAWVLPSPWRLQSAWLWQLQSAWPWRLVLA
jgi:hypothetical protein